MRDKVEFTFVDETGLCHKHYIGYDYTKAGSCCGIQVLADIFIAEWRNPDGIDDEDEGWFSTLSYRNISKELKLEAFKKNGLAFREIKLPEIDEFSLGQIMTLSVLETVSTCYFLGVNPFDQPAVEQGKILTRKYLS